MITLIAYSTLFMRGVGVTLAAWLLAASISITLGTILAIVSSRYAGSKKIIAGVKIYTFITKGIPAYVQILIAYFVIPSLLNINIPGFIAASFALAICSSGYVTEIVRAGINAIPAGQWHACFVLGYTKFTSIKRIIMPQVLPVILPALMGELEQLLKSTSLLAIIGVTELTRVGMNIISRDLNPLPVYFTVAVIYLILSAALQMVTLYTERKMRYGYY